VDGFNQLVTIERALAGGAILRGRDSALRDIASVHGTWRRSESTQQAIALVARSLPASGVAWVLDAPVSNSGRLAQLLREQGPGWAPRWWPPPTPGCPSSGPRATRSPPATAGSSIGARPGYRWYSESSRIQPLPTRWGIDPGLWTFLEKTPDDTAGDRGAV